MCYVTAEQETILIQATDQLFEVVCRGQVQLAAQATIGVIGSEPLLSPPLGDN